MFSFCGNGSIEPPCALYCTRMATSRVGTGVWAMKAQLARFVIFQIAMLVALVIFITMNVGWLSAVLIVISVIAGLGLGDLAFHRLADPEIMQRDLEERVRNQHL
jgi:fatty acid desaturase